MEMRGMMNAKFWKVVIPGGLRDCRKHKEYMLLLPVFYFLSRLVDIRIQVDYTLYFII